ncbi:helix-turn-helix domain-containing protein [Natroniella sulfidigena]|uniref:CdaR family transcriptional regulator n=1 Tax=Natroniella sulfidigena TaxID=723921 RepID=UPI00200A1714|nr:sugar diacid recognition domain-containing protein [Natroniella sulfidigena]MCK8816333.1 helix-turn-helix domain-containing protein [Natroniella sulfidigena]
MEQDKAVVLTAKLAQTIVDQTIEIVGENINIMNQDGVIIGSGNSARVGTLHEGAKFVIEKQEVFEIYEEDEERLKGVKPGVNWPIYFDDQIIGVVGVTGAPQDVEKYAGLVKMTAELMLQQNFYLKRLQFKEQAEEEFIKKLLDKKVDLTDQILKNRAESMGYRLDGEYIILLLELSNLWEGLLKNLQQNIDTKLQKIKQEIQDKVQTFYDQSEKVKVAHWEGEQFVILRIEMIDGQRSRFSEQEAERLVEYLSSTTDFRCKIGVGDDKKGLDSVRESFEEALTALELGKKFYNKEEVYYYDDLLIEDLASSLSIDLRSKLTSDLPLAEPLAETLQVYFANDLNVSQTANQLFLHRNSILYRLNQIKEQTGLDPKKFTDLIKLKLGLLCDELEKEG